MKKAKVKVGNRFIGDGQPVYIIAEIGINHNGSIEIAKKMIDGAAFAGCDAVKFQKRTPELCVPKDQWDIQRDTPWGKMTYIDYRRKIEFSKDQYAELDRYCKSKGIDWFASCWDEESVDFIQEFNPSIFKIASATLTDLELISKIKSTGKPAILSTGMSTMEEIRLAVEEFGKKNLLIAHSTSSYPCKLEELNLKMILTLKHLYKDIPIGYSGHETGLAPTWAAVALGASFIERHITLDRALWGTDQAASVEIVGLFRLVSSIRDIERSMGDGIKKVYLSELSSLKKLRRKLSSRPIMKAV
ncbi:MAG: N-acetylneuraminate synthase family protein [Bacteroidota bacterium]|nr:N-acetylneuraminate synthase family protein [Bacteroidota bacterium]MDP4192527.1 N-acetylneuraminate synthase family protein [Bacteroidota bacterium]MDP4194125.1 N-acetylneuraminate synthase family protein [Bacteroidota bacterium]